MTNSRFRKALRADFGDMDIQTKEELRTLMQKAGYRRIKEGRDYFDAYPTQKQIDGAFDYLTGRVATQRQIVTDFIKEKYGNRYTYRANRDLILTSLKYPKGYKYRKGQFIPKR